MAAAAAASSSASSKAEKTNGVVGEVVPIVPLPFIELACGGITLASKVLEIGVDLAGDEALRIYWYRHVQTVPIIWQINCVMGFLGLLGMLDFFRRCLPQAIRRQERALVAALRCAPGLLIPVMVVWSGKSAELHYPGWPPEPHVLTGPLYEARVVLLVVPCIMALCAIGLFYVLARGQGQGVRRRAGADAQEFELVPLVEPVLPELLSLWFMLGLCLYDLGLCIRGDEELASKWAEHRWRLPVARLAQGAVAVGAILKVAAALVALPKAARGESGRLAGCWPLVLVPAFAVCCLLEENRIFPPPPALLSQVAALPGLSRATSAAAAKVVLVFIAILFWFGELIHRNKGVIGVERVPTAPAAGADKLSSKKAQ